MIVRRGEGGTVVWARAVCIGNSAALLGVSVVVARLKTFFKLLAAALGLAGLAVAGVYIFGLFAILDALDNEAEKPRKAAVETLVCPESQVQIRDRLATGCGRMCRIHEEGSSASWFSSYGCELVSAERRP